eukprot:6203311-Pleurochrysis_carterae.AAC.3
MVLVVRKAELLQRVTMAKQVPRWGKQSRELPSRQSKLAAARRWLLGLDSRSRSSRNACR